MTPPDQTSVPFSPQERTVTIPPEHPAAGSPA